MSEPIPFLFLGHQHRGIEKAMLSATKRVFNSNHFILGKEVLAFEKEFAAFSGTKFCAGTGNGLDALSLSLRALGIGKGDEVIVPSNTCQPTWLAVSISGARCVPVEPDELTMNISPRGIDAAITNRTKAIIPVHLYGQPCEMDKIMSIGRRHDIHIVEDNAQAHGATFKGKTTGSFGIVNATSFYPTKNLGALGDGGAITTNDRRLHETVSGLRNYGTELPGINSRLDELQAALLSVKLAKLSKWTKTRQIIGARYLKQLADVPELQLPLTAKNAEHVYHLFVIRTQHRDALRRHLEKKGIGTLIHYPVPPHLQKVNAEHGFRKGQFPIAEEISNTCLSLPVWPGLKASSVDRICEEIALYFR
ncbi:MAG: DegT/DnrJ/EryC1/StrS family aminotransferase [Bacteroidota bacterium]